MEKGKSRKNKKGWIIILLVLFVVAGVGVCYGVLPQAHAADENREPVLEEGQEYTYAEITSILGNEMTYVVLDAQTVDFDESQERGRGKSARSYSENASEGRHGVAVAQDGETPLEGAFTETDEVGQIQIPVGTEVETKLGTVTTFSRLSNGDMIKMLLQKDRAGNKALMKIWIMK